MSKQGKKGVNAGATGKSPAASGAAAPDFGAAGKITVRTDVPAVAIHIDRGEFLSYKLTVAGVSPIFTFACQHRKIKTDSDFPVSPTYQWTYFQNLGDEDAHDDVYTVGMSFLGAPITYTLVVNKCDKAGALIQALKDKDFASTDPNDFFLDSLRVFSI
jgi:hypothetical protein